MTETMKMAVQKTQYVLAAALCAVLASGCGTVCNLVSGDPAQPAPEVGEDHVQQPQPRQ